MSLIGQRVRLGTAKTGYGASGTVVDIVMTRGNSTLLLVRQDDGTLVSVAPGMVEITAATKRTTNPGTAPPVLILPEGNE